MFFNAGDYQHVVELTAHDYEYNEPIRNQGQCIKSTVAAAVIFSVAFSSR